MIKTMLLTAQLALSPIVGTNGLQPKRLANPVYGESVDMSVTYNGVEYERWIYSENDYVWNLNHATQDYLYIYRNGIDYYSDGDTPLSTNMAYQPLGLTNCFGLFDGDTWYSEQLRTDNYYLRFIFGMDDYAQQIEVFASGQSYHTKMYSYFFNTGELRLLQDNDQVPDYSETDTGIKSVNYYCFGYNPEKIDPDVTNEGWQAMITAFKSVSIAQWEAPTIPNPSVYDNIYNFYYENLFANDALDDLNAEVGSNSLTMRQWLAHTATIISISLLACALIILVIKIFKLIAGSLSDIWG